MNAVEEWKIALKIIIDQHKKIRTDLDGVKEWKLSCKEVQKTGNYWLDR